MGAALTTTETKHALLKSLERFDVSKLSAFDRRQFRENARRFMTDLKKLRRQPQQAAALKTLAIDEEETA